MDVAEVLAPASDHGPEMQDLAQTQADQVVDVESAEQRSGVRGNFKAGVCRFHWAINAVITLFW